MEKFLISSVLPIAFSVLSMLFGGCSTPSVEMKTPPRDTPWTGTAFLLDYDFITQNEAVRTQGCTLILSNVATNQEYFADLKPNVHEVLFEVPSGAYIGKTLSCPHFVKWDLSALFRGPVQLQEGRINYLGRISFNFADDDSSLKTVQGDQRATLESLSLDIQSFSNASWVKALFNPFSNKAITADMLITKNVYEMEIHSGWTLKQGQEASGTGRVESELKICDQNEQKRVPYRLGSLNDVATYQNGKMTDLKKSENNTFSDGFLTCIDRAFRQFQPGSQGKLVLSVKI